MKTATLGSEGPEISRLGVGSWFWSPGDEDEKIAVIRRAIEAGVTWVDTAPIYGLGLSERVTGRAVAPYLDDGVRVFSKCGLPWRDSGGTAIVRHDLRPASIRIECEESLQRLGVERIDLYQVHWPDFSGATEIEEAWGTMVELQQEGKVGWLGASNFTPDELDRCEAIRHIDSLQQPVSLLHREALRDLVPRAAEHGTALLAYSPMAAGFLTGTFDRARAEAIPDDDFRRLDPNFKEPQLTANLDLLGRLRGIADRLGCSMVELALGWVLSRDGVTHAIVGGSTPSQVDAWLDAPSLALSPTDLDEIQTALEETGAGDEVLGPTSPKLDTLGPTD